MAASDKIQYSGFRLPCLSLSQINIYLKPLLIVFIYFRFIHEYDLNQVIVIVWAIFNLTILPVMDVRLTGTFNPLRPL